MATWTLLDALRRLAALPLWARWWVVVRTWARLRKLQKEASDEQETT